MMTNQSKRIDWIDLAKGITILLVVVGHSFGFSGQPLSLRLIRGLIFSFHMPLFFVLSMTTYRLSDSNDLIIKKAEKAFVHLMIPAIVLYFLQSILFVVLKWEGESISSFLARFINTFVYASGCQINIGDETIPGIGMIWFFVALYIGRILYDFLQLKLNKKLLIIVICSLSVVGVLIGRIQWLPFSFDVILAILPLFAVGAYLKKCDFSKRFLLYGILSLVIWLFSFGITFYIKHNYLELALRSYPLYPLCFITALSGVIFVCCLSVALLKIPKISIPFLFIGKNSMYFFWAHIMDYLFQPIWGISPNPLITVMLRLSVDTILFILIISLVKLLRHLKHYHHNYKEYNQ